jgi:hypothetical protein
VKMGGKATSSWTQRWYKQIKTQSSVMHVSFAK